MASIYASCNRQGSLLSRYTQRMGALADRRLSQFALEAARREAENATREAETASRTKTQFLANMSHELNTPLSSIIGFAEMMARELRGPLAPVYRGYARHIAESGRQLQTLLGDVLDMSQLDSGAYRLVEQPIDVAATLETLVGEVRGRAAQAGLLLQARLPGHLPRLSVDPRCFAQAMANLLSNAIKYTAAGGRIYVLPELTEAGDLAINVIDTGIGITPSEIARITKPFERATDAMTRRHTGAGLGLALTAAMMQLHGGTLALQSKLGVGTIATVTFPASRLAPARDTADPTHDPAAEPSGDATAPDRPGRPERA